MSETRSEQGTEEQGENAAFDLLRLFHHHAFDSLTNHGICWELRYDDWTTNNLFTSIKDKKLESLLTRWAAIIDEGAEDHE